MENLLQFFIFLDNLAFILNLVLIEIFNKIGNVQQKMICKIKYAKLC